MKPYSVTYSAPYSVLMVCMGNICRSPTAHGVLRHKAQALGLQDTLVVDSAGPHNYHPGSPPDARSQSHATLAAWLQERPELRATLTDALLVNLLSSSRRESALMMDTAEQRYMQFLAEHSAIAERVALHHVASHLGITNVALSRVRRRIRERQAAAGLRAGALRY